MILKIKNFLFKFLEKFPLIRFVLVFLFRKLKLSARVLNSDFPISNVEKIRGIQYGELSGSTGNPVALYLWMAGAGGYNAVNTDSQVIKVWLTGTVAAGRNVGPEAADALIDVINDSSVYGIIDYPVGSDWVVLSAEITWLP